METPRENKALHGPPEDKRLPSVTQRKALDDWYCDDCRKSLKTSREGPKCPLCGAPMRLLGR